MTNFLFLLQTSTENPASIKIFTVFFIVFGVLVIGRGLFKFVEGFYVDFIAKKPLFRHLYLFTNDLNSNQKRILEKQFNFYTRLDSKQQKYFRHRVYKFISHVEFTGKEGLEINDEKKTLVAATAIMLTFGYRDYAINLVDKILIYPTVFYSNLDKNYHKGHFNPGYRAVILSWEDFVHGHKIKDDNLNLGIHEFVHALHLSYLSSKNNNDISAHIFTSSLEALHAYIQSKVNLRLKMENSKYFRSYAFKNDFEFTAVIIENFIETPNEFKAQFPNVYRHVKQMLNFNFTGY
ncbi:zinc-dependent peptidase [Lacinutrix sp. C3R15]|uniref:zinc-dependent peptidase n=1 Tax=Flavobacteriaceae TaxID=49546 RepID=UPI001C08A658|nr:MULTISPECIES: zinc-dependent peptidase [Flavobacteriaceae]MBU2939242.1 zinc-dependent peptidase [Lacinutrix sp. C3R15]MDO6622557.1 zinc-dependent peptidase [Oceanihabitans sp. 1_MG-2023]